MNNSNTMSNPLGFESVSTLTRKFAIPSIIAMLVTSLYNIVDQLFIGNAVGTLGNAATNVVFPINILCLSIALLFGIGGSAAFNLAMGANDTKNAPYIIGSSSTLVVLLGILFSTASFVFSDPLLIFMGCPNEVLPYAREYLKICALGFPFFMLSASGSHIVRADGSPNITMIVNIIGAVINTILDAVFVLILHWGMAGAAAATIIGQFVTFVIIVFYFCNFKTVKLKPKHFIPKLKPIGRSISLGAAPFFNQIAFMVTQIVLNNSLTYYGGQSQYGESIPLTVAGITMKSFQVFFSIIIGIAQGAQPIASFNYGAKKFDRVKLSYNVSIKAGMIIGIIIFVIFQIFPTYVLRIFGDGSELYFEFGSKFIRIFMFTSFLAFLQPITSTFFTAIGKSGQGIFLSLTRQVIFMIPLLIILPLFIGLDGILYTTPIADILSFAACLILIIKEFKRAEYKDAPKFKLFAKLRGNTTMSGDKIS